MILAMFKTEYRGRFAPSPTGALHAGSLATALGSWLDARAHQGKWLLRIEDLDLPRCVPGADKIIIQQLLNCGLHWDEEIEYQSKRSHFYESALNQLKQEKKAYGCRCTRKQIEDQLLRLGKKKDRHGELVYPGSCRNLNEVTEPCAWRLLVTDPEIESSVGDFVLRRSDRVFTYQLTVVVDDYLQGITHIVRGEDLLDNTARQIYLQKQLGYPQPHYLHLPLVLDDNNEKLSKQTNATAIACNNSGEALEALQAAARHLGLDEPELFKKGSDSTQSSESTINQSTINQSTIKQWLETAVEHYRKTRL
jgi:glutamyl-Q tRNA(Asp) synthetase